MQHRTHGLALGSSVFLQLLAGCGEQAAEGGAGGAAVDGGGGGNGGAPACEPPYEQLGPGEIVTLPEASWPGPVLISRDGGAGEIGYVSLDEDGTVRWFMLGFDYSHAGAAVWDAEAGGVVVSEGERGLDWPLAQSAGISAIDLQRVDDRYIAAHLTATSGDSDQLWVVGGLCGDCTSGPAYPCAFDFDEAWQLLEYDE
jgi:hypothetical protein